MPNLLDLDFVLIPEAEFIIGSDSTKDRSAQPDESPQHRLRVTDYYIMRNLVTNAQYRQFIEATGHRPPLFNWPEGKFPTEMAQHPVVGISFHDAISFCRWAREATGLSVRLPTEPEWEKAARGTDGRLFPWGNEWEIGRCNSVEAKLKSTTPVGKFSPQGNSPYGVSDLAGNVQEWCSSLFGAYPYDPGDGREVLVYNMNPEELLPKIVDTGCTSVISSQEASLQKSVIRGGSWREGKLVSRCAYRGWAAPMHRSDDTGFRCAYEPE